jgi:cyclopropane-fatty-acyl-phospholipid synthase
VRTVHDKETDAKAISYHYDLSNAFYQLWLDSDMAYSCAYFETGSETLEQAQQDKFRHLCRKLRLQPGDYLLDVGCGWGGLARVMRRVSSAPRCSASPEQGAAGPGPRAGQSRRAGRQVELQLLDYRDLPQDGRFDKVVSVGMFEHVGHANLAEYCKSCSVR